MRKVIVIVLVSLMYAQGCSSFDWNTAEYFKTAAVESVKRDLRAGADVNAQDENGWTPLHRAAVGNENPEVIAVLLNAGADVNAKTDIYSYTPLHYAASSNENPEVLTILLDAGADPRAKTRTGLTVWDLSQSNEALKNTEAYWRLNDLRY